MTAIAALTRAESDAKTAWSRRVRKVGGFIQVAFAAFWLIRGSLNIDSVGLVLAAAFTALVAVVVVYGIRATSGAAPRPVSPEGKHIERAVTIASVVQLVASFAAPAIVVAAGRSDWLLPSIAVTIGPLLLWLDHRVDIARYRPAGWALIVGPLLLIAIMSGTALAATTGIASGAILLGIAGAGFHDLARSRPGRTAGRAVPVTVPR